MRLSILLRDLFAHAFQHRTVAYGVFVAAFVIAGSLWDQRIVLCAGAKSLSTSPAAINPLVPASRDNTTLTLRPLRWSFGTLRVPDR